MSINAIQFQRGLSLPQFQARYGSEPQCEQALVAARWPHGWQCAHCGCKRFFLTRNGPGRQLWECFVCGYQSSSIVGTVMEHTHLPLRLWFLAMYLLTQNKNAISALALKRQLGVSYKTAWLLKHKLMQAMSQRDARYRLSGRVEIDDAYLGGERAGHIYGGRKPANKTAFVAAVQTHPDGRPLYMRLTPVADFTNQDMAQWAARHLAPGCHVVSDGTRAFAQVRQVGATHERQSPAAAVRAPKRLSCTGSTPCWATSRPAWWAPTTRLTTPNMVRAIWPSSAIASTGGLTCLRCCTGCCGRWRPPGRCR